MDAHVFPSFDESSSGLGLEDLVSTFMDLQQSGQAPTVEEFVASHPRWADELRDLLPTLLTMEAAREQLSEPIPLRVPERLGDFRVGREIGRGGMGIVYEAEQISLHRQVALKVLPSGFLQDESRVRRFEREATIAANLHHPNIVPVFGVGDEGGFRFIVMQLIRGESLAQRIAGLSLEPDRSESSSSGDARPTSTARDYRHLAQLMLQAARGLEFAHEQGMLHRDVKPSNLLLGDYDHVWLADFGLARALDFSDVSRTGEIVGTWRYMAPEQRLGNASVVTDVYGLGATFYEFVTLQPLLSQEQLNAWIAGVRSPPSPRRPRSFCPDIPRDLETILMKCVEQEPQRRYATAGALADDLQRFIEHRPIHARPVSWVEEGVKWSRRNPLAAALSGVTVVLATLVLVTALLGYWFEAQQRSRAEETRQIALQAIDRVFDKLTPNALAPATSNFNDPTTDQWVAYTSQPFVSADTAEMLGELLPVLDQLSALEGDNAQLSLTAARASRRMGDIQLRLGDFEASAASYATAATRLAALRPLPLDLPSLQREEVALALQQALLAVMDRRPSEAQDAVQTVIQELEAQENLSAGLRFELARAYYLLTVTQRELASPLPGWFPPRPGPGGPPRGRPPAGGPVGDRPPWIGPPRFGPPDAGPPDVGNWVRGPGPRRGRRGRGRGPASGPPDFAAVSAPAMKRAIEHLETLQAGGDQGPEVSFLLALCYRDLGPLQPGPPLTDAEDEAALQILRQLVHDYPDVPDYQLELADTLARMRPRPGLGPRDPQAMLDSLDEAESLITPLLGRSPESPRCLETAARILDRRAAHRMELGRWDAARSDLDRAKSEAQKLVTRQPDHVGHVALLIGLLQQRTRLFQHLGRPDLARAEADEGLALLAAWQDVAEVEPYVRQWENGFQRALRPAAPGEPTGPRRFRWERDPPPTPDSHQGSEPAGASRSEGRTSSDSP